MTDKEQYKFIYFNKLNTEVILRRNGFSTENTFMVSLSEFLPFTKDSLYLFQMLHPNLVKHLDSIQQCLDTWRRDDRLEYSDSYYSVQMELDGDGKEIILMY